MSDSLWPHALHTIHGILQASILEWVAFPFSRGSSQPRDQTQVSRIAGEFFTIWATREAQEYWNGSLSLLQGIFPTLESNRGPLHCRRILYQLSCQGSPLVSLGWAWNSARLTSSQVMLSTGSLILFPQRTMGLRKLQSPCPWFALVFVFYYVTETEWESMTWHLNRMTIASMFPC